MVYSRPFLFYGPSAMPRLGLMDQRGVPSAVLGPTRSQTQIRNYFQTHARGQPQTDSPSKIPR